MPMSVTKRRVARQASLWLLAGLLAGAPEARSQTGSAQAKPSEQRQSLTVGVFADAYPFSYVDADGHEAGFTTELLNAVANAENLRIVRVSDPAVRIVKRFQDGEFDLLQFRASSPERQRWAEFSVPFLTLQGCVYVREGGNVRELKDLAGEPFGVIGETGLGRRFLADNHVAASIVTFATEDELMRKLSQGEIAGCFMSQFAEMAVTRRLNIANIRILGAPFHGYDFQLSFAVHPGDAELLARLNEGLAIVHQTGEYDRIYQRSFGQYESFALSGAELELYGSIALAFAFVIALWGYFRQVNLRRELSFQTAKLAEQGALLQALYDNVPMAMTVVEAGSSGARVISMNRQACSLYSAGAGAQGTALEDLPVSESIRQHLVEAVAQAPGGSHVRVRETILENGKRSLQVTSVALALSEDKATKRICILVEDITDRLLRDAEMVRSRKLRAVGELVGGIAHEFNNLLTPVMLKAGEIVLTRPDDRALHQDIEVISQAVKRTAELTRRLLSFGRRVEYKAEVIRLGTVAAGCFDLLKHTVDRRITWENTIPAALPPLYFNSTDLNQILLNLLLNARDALIDRLSGTYPENWVPRIRIEAEQLPPAAFPLQPSHRDKTLLGWQRLTVRDNALGMRPDVVERIFEPFFTTKGVGKGTGLGLATVWHLVTDSGGHVSVESTLGVGSAFHVVLPVWPIVETAMSDRAPAKAAKPARVLLVEDEALVARPIIEILKRHGHQVRHFENGLEAWRHIEDNLGSYDLLIVDVNLPGMNGIDVVSRVRERNFQGRIFMVSGRFTTADMEALTRLRIDHSLTKPFNVTEFLEALNEALGAKRS